MQPRIARFKGKYHFLSNFSASPLAVAGRSYQTVEHAYQSAKANSEEERRAIIEAATPGKAKRLGRKVKMATPSMWDGTKDGLMKYLVYQKFKQNRELKDMLLGTGDAELVEGNQHHDNYWGACICVECSDKFKQNKLGIILMEVRDMLRDLE